MLMEFLNIDTKVKLIKNFQKFQNLKQGIFLHHLIPTFRGMLSSIYVQANKGVTIKKIYNELKKVHKKNYFIKILPVNKDLGTENVINTNFAKLAFVNLKKKIEF